MQYVVVAVGKQLTGGLREIAEDYQKRLQSTSPIEWQLLPASQQSGDQARAEESANILKKLKPSDVVVLLDERGVELDNPGLAARLTKLAGMQGRLVFVIGGAFGVDQAVRDRAQLVWSLSALVFPHQLIRVMLLEQLYRTQAVISGHPYHHV